jgi:hypothetical protein
MAELNDFYNYGFGWICRHCDPPAETNTDAGVGRFFLEGETESKSPELSSRALAKWLDPAHQILTCPLCGVTELADRT